MWGPRVREGGAWVGTTRPEHNVQMALVYTGEVGNGGHTQFFTNRRRRITARVQAALSETGLHDLSAILDSAAAMFPGQVVPDRPEDVDSALRPSTSENRARAMELDRKVWKTRGVDERLLEYLRLHQEEILRPERGLSW